MKGVHRRSGGSQASLRAHNWGIERWTNKLEGVAAIEEYTLDAEAAGDQDVRAAFERIEQRERESIDELRELLCDRQPHIQTPLTCIAHTERRTTDDAAIS
jgi:hypothetical protein